MTEFETNVMNEIQRLKESVQQLYDAYGYTTQLESKIREVEDLKRTLESERFRLKAKYCKHDFTFSGQDGMWICVHCGAGEMAGGDNPHPYAKKQDE